MNNKYIYISNVSNNTNETIYAEIGLKGGNITRIQNNDRDILWQNESQLWPNKDKILRGAQNQPSPILFPIAGPLNTISSYDMSNYPYIEKDGQRGFLVNGQFYSEDTKGYFYDSNFYPMNQHGFTRDSEFEIIDYYNDGCLLRLKSNEETKKQYPFDFQLDVQYKAVRDGINIKYTVRNTGEKMLPFNIGEHPGFKLDDNIDSYYLQFDSNDNTYVQYKDGQGNNKIKNVNENNRLYFDDEMFKSKKAVNMKNVSSDKVVLYKKCNNNEDDKPIVIYDIRADNLLLWTVDTSGLLCIEPWYASSRLFNSFDENIQNGKIKQLAPNEEFSYSRRMRFPNRQYMKKWEAVKESYNSKESSSHK